MRFIIQKVYEKSSGGDYAEFEEMRRSLLAWAGESDWKPAQRHCTPSCGHDSARGDLIRLLAILGS